MWLNCLKNIVGKDQHSGLSKICLHSYHQSGVQCHIFPFSTLIFPFLFPYSMFLLLLSLIFQAFSPIYARSSFSLYTIYFFSVLAPLFSVFKPAFASRILKIQEGANNKIYFPCFPCQYVMYLEASGNSRRKPYSHHCSLWRFLMQKFKKPSANSFYTTFSFGQYFVDFDKISKTCTQCKNNNWKMSNFLLSSRGGSSTAQWKGQ